MLASFESPVLKANRRSSKKRDHVHSSQTSTLAPITSDVQTSLLSTKPQALTHRFTIELTTLSAVVILALYPFNNYG